MNAVLSVLLLWGLLPVQGLLVQGAAGAPLERPGEDEAVTVADLRCEYLTDPLGIDVLRPRLSWRIEGAPREWRQSAYQVLVARSKEDLQAGSADVWDSGRVSSDRSVHVPYGGAPLSSGAAYFWKVRVWDADGRASGWSTPATWTMGLLSPGEWNAQWIGLEDTSKAEPAPLYRSAFVLGDTPVKRATAYISGLGYYELYLNGRKVGSRVLDPAFTDYEDRVLYATYDVTDLLVRHENALGVTLGNGWYNVHTRAGWDFDEAPWRDKPKLLLQLAISYDDGRLDQEEIGQHVHYPRIQQDTYILKGGGTETYAPRFVYHGFQYVEVEGYPGTPKKENFEGQVVHTAFEQIGRFKSSDALLNQIQHNTRWSYIGNFHGYPTDCPHREKNGWTGDAQLAAETGLYNYASAAAYTKWLDDVRDTQREDGRFADIVPTSGWGYGIKPAWDAAYILIPWYLYLYRGDQAILAKHFDGMKRYMALLQDRAEGHVWS